MFACFIFMLIRKFTREKVFLFMPTYKELQLQREGIEGITSQINAARENVDFLQATKVVIGLFNCIWMPVFMFGLYRYNYVFDLDLPKREWQFLMLHKTQLVAAIFILPDVFIKSPVLRSSITLQIAFRIAALLVCLVIPIMSVWVAITASNDQPCFSFYYWFYALMSVFLLYHLNGAAGARGLQLSDLWTFVDQ